jgi:hypothetical protein
MNSAKRLAYDVVLACLRGMGMRGGSARPAVTFFKPDRIGDFVLATGAIRFCSRVFGGNSQVLAVSSMVAPLAPRDQHVDAFGLKDTWNVEAVALAAVEFAGEWRGKAYGHSCGSRMLQPEAVTWLALPARLE